MTYSIIPDRNRSLCWNRQDEPDMLKCILPEAPYLID